MNEERKKQEINDEEIKKEEISDEEYEEMKRKVDLTEHDAKDEYVTKDPEELRAIFARRLQKSKGTIFGVVLAMVFSVILAVAFIYNVVVTKENYETSFYAIGLAAFVLVTCTISLIIEFGDRKKYKKALENPLEYRDMLVRKTPAYESDALTHKTIGGKKKFWR